MQNPPIANADSVVLVPPLADTAKPKPLFGMSGTRPESSRMAQMRLYAKLPSYGQVYMNQLIGEFNSLKEVCTDPKARDLAQSLITNAEREDEMTWGDAYELDTAIAQMLPKEYLHQRAWCLEVKYRDAVGNAAAYDAFMRAEAPDLIEETEEHLRARIHNLIRELYRLYTVISCRAEMREKILKTALIVLICIWGVGGFCWAARFRWPILQSFEVWTTVFAVGATGGLLSLYLKLQSLPSHGESLSDLVELSDRMIVPLTPIIGGTFAVVLLWLFAGGLASGSLFPALKSKDAAGDLWSFVAHLQPENVTEWGKLFVWSFVAGFAERLVPDTLDRLIANSNEKKRDIK